MLLNIAPEYGLRNNLKYVNGKAIAVMEILFTELC